MGQNFLDIQIGWIGHVANDHTGTGLYTVTGYPDKFNTMNSRWSGYGISGSIVYKEIRMVQLRIIRFNRIQ